MHKFLFIYIFNDLRIMIMILRPETFNLKEE